MYIARMKKTGRIGYDMGKCGNNHRMILFPFDKPSHDGKLGVCQPVRDENVRVEKQEPGFVE